jgi:acetyl/propionyl-CoA carboxylase alpha subunit
MLQIKTEGQLFQVQQEYQQWKVNDVVLDWDIVPTGPQSFHIIYQHTSYQAEIIQADYTLKTFSVKVNGHIFQLEAKDRFDLLLERMGMSQVNSGKINELKAPMPGLILEVIAAEGSEVKKGDSLLILEAMKMENIIKSPGDGVVKSLKIQKGDRVEKNQVLIVFA